MVHADELAGERMGQMPPTMPRAIYDLLFPSATPSRMPTLRAEPVSSIHDAVSKVARGIMVHPTMVGMPYAYRDDIEAVPLVGWPWIPLGLTWCTAHENARIRALAETVRVLAYSKVDLASAIQQQG
jgi:hypothetical protein